MTEAAPCIIALPNFPKNEQGMTSKANLLRNRNTEKDVRDWLQANGYQGDSARFGQMELRAVKRPGWLQVFEFDVDVKDNDGVRREFLGIARDDQRRAIEAFLADSSVEQQRVFREWSEGLITLRRKQTKASVFLLILFAAFLSIAAVGAVVSNF